MSFSDEEVRRFAMEKLWEEYVLLTGIHPTLGVKGEEWRRTGVGFPETRTAAELCFKSNI